MVIILKDSCMAQQFIWCILYWRCLYEFSTSSTLGSGDTENIL